MPLLMASTSHGTTHLVSSGMRLLHYLATWLPSQVGDRSSPLDLKSFALTCVPGVLSILPLTRLPVQPPSCHTMALNDHRIASLARTALYTLLTGVKLRSPPK